MLLQASRPVKNLPVSDLLFGDCPLPYWAGINTEELPWSLFKKVQELYEQGSDPGAIDILHEILALPGLESRQYLQANYFLRQLYSVTRNSAQLFGVVVEVGMENGTDLLAVYADYSARYYSYSGSAIVWENRSEAMDGKIDYILMLGNDIVTHIGPWNAERPATPRNGYARINFLTSTGLHFGEAAQAVLFKDPLAGKIMYAMLDMMKTLIEMRNYN